MEDIVIGNDEPPRAVMVWKLQSTHVGEMFGMPASGKRIDRTIAFVLTLRDGLIYEREPHLRFHEHADAARRAAGKACARG